MIRAAEATGTLQETLDDMVKYYTEVNSTRKEMKSALIYHQKYAYISLPKLFDNVIINLIKKQIF